MSLRLRYIVVGFSVTCWQILINMLRGQSLSLLTVAFVPMYCSTVDTTGDDNNLGRVIMGSRTGIQKRLSLIIVARARSHGVVRDKIKKQMAIPLITYTCKYNESDSDTYQRSVLRCRPLHHLLPLATAFTRFHSLFVAMVSTEPLVLQFNLQHAPPSHMTLMKSESDSRTSLLTRDYPSTWI